MITARLTERDNHEYVLEVDVTSMLAGAVQPPMLPDGFTNKETQYARRGALLNVRYPFSGSRNLSHEDVLLLPWARTGVLLHAKWADGSRSSGMFLSRVEGIPIPIAQLRPLQLSRGEQLRNAFKASFGGAAGHLLLWIPVLAIAALLPRARAMQILWISIAGFTAALILSDLFLPDVGNPFAVGLMLLAALFTARRPQVRLSPLFFISTAMLGLSQLPQGDAGLRFASTLGLLAAFGGGGALLILLRAGLRIPVNWQPARLLLGSLAVAGLLHTVLDQTPSPAEARMAALPAQAASQNATRQAPRAMTRPFMVFLTIEPYEIRMEIMASGPAVTDHLGISLENPRVIQIAEQERLKTLAIQDLLPRIKLEADDLTAEPSSARGDFLTLGAAGAYTRGNAVDETVETAILGLTFVYIRPEPPQEITVTWNHLPADTIPVTVIDPSGNRGAEFTSDSRSVRWRNSEAFEIAEITAVDIVHPEWSPVALVLLCAAGFVSRKPKAAYAGLTLSILLFPVVRMPVPFGLPMDRGKAEPAVQQLLSNIYHAFDYREEGAIYDRLSISVAGDQLTEIYLNQRRALELENRGGARARVEKVEIDEIGTVRGADAEIAVEAWWNVSGSVNHFGHTHYRRNAYHATLHLSAYDGSWKITGIEVHDEERIY